MSTKSCDCLSCVMSCVLSTIASKFKENLLYWLDFDQTWQHWSLFIVQMVLVHCISRSNELILEAKFKLN